MSDGSSDYTLRTIGMNDIVQICVLLGELLQDDMTIPKIGRIEYHPGPSMAHGEIAENSTLVCSGRGCEQLS